MTAAGSASPSIELSSRSGSPAETGWGIAPAFQQAATATNQSVEFGSAIVIQKNVADTNCGIVPGDGEHRHRQVVMPGRVHGDESIDEAAQQQLGIFLDQIGTVMVAGDEIEITFFQKMLFNAAHHQRGVAFADLRNQHSDCEAALCASPAGGKTWPVIQIAGSGKDTFLGRSWN